MAASGGAWTHPLLRGAHEPTGVVSVSDPSGAALASRPFAAQPQRPRALGSHAAPHHPLAAPAYRLSSLSTASHGRPHLRQEPDAGIPTLITKVFVRPMASPSARNRSPDSSNRLWMRSLNAQSALA